MPQPEGKEAQIVAASKRKKNFKVKMFKTEAQFFKQFSKRSPASKINSIPLKTFRNC